MINPSDLGFLFNAIWDVIPLTEVQKSLRKKLMDIPDESLILAFYCCFVNDFKVKKEASNLFNLHYVEYEPSYYDAFKENTYSGEELIELMLTKFETPAHLCNLYNDQMDDCIFPWKDDRNNYLICKK